MAEVGVPALAPLPPDQEQEVKLPTRPWWKRSETTSRVLPEIRRYAEGQARYCGEECLKYIRKALDGDDEVGPAYVAFAWSKAEEAGAWGNVALGASPVVVNATAASQLSSGGNKEGRPEKDPSNTLASVEVEEAKDGTCVAPTPFVDTPILRAKRQAFDRPTQVSLDALIAAVRSDERRALSHEASARAYLIFRAFEGGDLTAAEQQLPFVGRALRARAALTQQHEQEITRLKAQK